MVRRVTYKIPRTGKIAASGRSTDAVFEVLRDERNLIGHGEDLWAFHPMKPMGVIDRFLNAGYDWSAAVFDQIWPDGPFRGQSIEQVMETVWRTVSNWLDEIDRLDEERHLAGSSKNGGT